MSDPSDDAGSALSHISLGTNDYSRDKAFYDAVLATLDIRCLMQHGTGAGYGRQFPEFWIGVPHDGGRADAGNGTHVCFAAQTIEQVNAFHAMALAHGATDDGAPGFRPQYAARYYGAFVIDLQGHKVEAMCWADPAAT